MVGPLEMGEPVWPGQVSAHFRGRVVRDLGEPGTGQADFLRVSS